MNKLTLSQFVRSASINIIFNVYDNKLSPILLDASLYDIMNSDYKDTAIFLFEIVDECTIDIILY